MPMRSSTAASGPIDALTLADTSMAMPASCGRRARWRADSVTPAKDTPTGNDASSDALPRSVKPLSLDHAIPRSPLACMPPAGRIELRKPSPLPAAMTITARLTSADTASEARASDSTTSSPMRAPPSSMRAPSGCPMTYAGSSSMLASVADALALASMVPGLANSVTP